MSKKKTDIRKYDAVHSWIRANHGTAPRCDSPECKGVSKRFHWALKKGKDYDWDIDCFIPLCVSCHQLYDVTDEARATMVKNSAMKARTHCKNGHLYDEKNTRIRIRKTIYGESTWRDCRACGVINQARTRAKRNKP